jgi:hypothetical protein
LSSVLNWHFSPTGSGHAPVVQISFQTPATPSRPAVEEKARVEKGERVQVTTRDPQGEAQTTELTLAAQDSLTTERDRTALTLSFLSDEAVQARKRLEALQSQLGASPEQISEARSQVAEMERRLAAGQAASAESEQRQHQIQERLGQLEKLIAAKESQPSTADNPEFRAQAERLEEIVPEQRAGIQNLTGRRLAAIEIRGLSDDAGKDLFSRLPLHQGDTLTPESMEAATRIIRQFDEHLEFSYGPEPGGAVLRIHPAGASGAPILRQK